jgi:hypothetical protein
MSSAHTELERVYRIARRVLNRNGFSDPWMRVDPIPDCLPGETRATVRIIGVPRVVFPVRATIFDSDDDIAVAVTSAVAPHLPQQQRQPVGQHEFVYCWCGHSGDSRKNEMGGHVIVAEGLTCIECGSDPAPVQSPRPRPAVCPSCPSGFLPFRHIHDHVRYCERCSGLGYLKPSYYR